MTPSSISPSFVAQALGLPAITDTRPFTSITTDSRKVEAGCLFVAIPGDKFDGHDFIAAAVKAGARGILCRKGTQVEAPPELHVFQSESDSVEAYRRLAAHWRRQFTIPVLCVAGSAGKTTTKELLAAIFRGRYSSILKTQGSQNGFVGIPMTLLELRPEHQIAVIEVGIDEPDTMERHLELVRPTATILTAIGPEHLEKLRDLPTVAREENLALSWTARNGGSIIVHLDDPWIRPHFERLQGSRKIAFTLDQKTAAALAPRHEELLHGVFTQTGSAPTLTCFGLGWDREAFPVPLPGPHNVSNLLGALAMARGQGLEAEEIRRGLATFVGATGRSELRTLRLGETAPGGPGAVRALCDYYNAQPASMEAAFTTFSELAPGGSRNPGTRWVCLGDMLELGAEENRYHRELATSLVRLGFEHVYLYGPRMKQLRDELTLRRFAGDLAHFESHAELAAAVLKGLRAGDALLIKGSRGMKMEELWKALTLAGADGQK